MLPHFLTLLRIASTLLVLAAAATFGVGACAQETYPSRQVTLIVPYPAGGVVDLTARLVAETLRETFNKPVIVLNKPGANGMIALAELVRTPADGYTLLLNNDGGLAIPPAVDPAACKTHRAIFLTWDCSKGTSAGFCAMSRRACRAKKSWSTPLATATRWYSLLGERDEPEAHRTIRDVSGMRVTAQALCGRARPHLAIQLPHADRLCPRRPQSDQRMPPGHA